ncbi:hypothetical protein BKP56_09090 [Marinilactibacillus sp. 15R]|uniref:DUF771 domain-containing protein n=1 Tax=Marinilactibacillus sp. 15R TaxID=1911586 RepID=UPI00090A3EF1|nr:DUF771 domain-containing protein [Marinilactibacillus sp. 15R]API89398.1 hypothetical protein BKP56_09090 [Marinilactibacillus sp. 15R]
MLQVLEARISIPEGYVLIKQEILDKSFEESLLGRYWEMKDLSERTGKSPQTLKEKILYPYREELDVKRGGFVKYPEGKGTPWRFGAMQMAKWLEENLESII